MQGMFATKVPQNSNGGLNLKVPNNEVPPSKIEQQPSENDFSTMQHLFQTRAPQQGQNQQLNQQQLN